MEKRKLQQFSTSKDEGSKEMSLKIGVVEDEVIIAESIMNALQELGYEVPEPAGDYMEALLMITREKPDLLLLDIRLNDTRDGIQLAERIQKEFDIPFIFLTANADRATVDRAKRTEPAAYLLKPFTKHDLYTSIEIAAVRHQLHGAATGQAARIFVKDGNVLRKVALHEILWLEADHVYLNMYTRHRKIILRSTMAQMIEQLNDARFMQIHRSYTVNTHYIEEVEGNNITISGRQLPVSKSYKEELINALQPRKKEH